MTSSKKCFKCGIEKPMDEFYRHPSMADGRLGKCKQCTKTDVAEHRSANIEKIRAYDRDRGKIPAMLAALRAMVGMTINSGHVSDDMAPALNMALAVIKEATGETE